MKREKLMVAFPAAAATPALIVAALLTNFNLALMFSTGFFCLLLPQLVFVFLIALIHCLFLGIPAFIIISRLWTINWPSILISSFIIGAVPLPLFTALSFGELNLYAAIFFGLMGVSAGITFGLLWRYWIEPIEKN
jgi:hypothetical protein